MSNEIQVFEKAEFGAVRTTMIDNDPYFCLADVCRALELSNPSAVADQVKEEFEGCNLNLHPFETAGGQQNLVIVSEQQLYYVLMRSRSVNAKPFRQWLYNEVIPTIRKTGSYSTTPTISTVEEVQLAELVLSELNPTDLMFAKNMIVLKNTGIDIIAKSGVNLIATDDRHPYSPTEIGVKVAEQMGLPKAYSPNIINSCLIEMGFQTFHRGAKNNRVYEFTELGKPYGRKVPRSKNDGSPILEVRWYDTVFGPVINHLAKKEK